MCNLNYSIEIPLRRPRGINNETRLGRMGREMDFRETEEQGMIREMVRDFAEGVLAPT